MTKPIEDQTLEEILDEVAEEVAEETYQEILDYLEDLESEDEHYPFTSDQHYERIGPGSYRRTPSSDE